MKEIPICVPAWDEIHEHLMCQFLLDYAKAFYQDPKNRNTYQEWRKKKSEK